MKITLELNDIDYSALVKVLLPVIQTKLEEKDGAIASILAKVAGMSPGIAGKMIDMMPQETKDEIAIMLINKNRDKIIENVLKYANQEGIHFRIDNFEVKES